MGRIRHLKILSLLSADSTMMRWRCIKTVMQFQCEFVNESSPYSVCERTNSQSQEAGVLSFQRHILPALPPRDTLQQVQYQGWLLTEPPIEDQRFD